MNTSYDFYRRLAQTINSGQSRSILLYGNTGDMFAVSNDLGVKYVPLVPFLNDKWASLTTTIQITVELNGPLSFYKPNEQAKDTTTVLRETWKSWKMSLNPGSNTPDLNKEFDENIKNSAAQPAFALEFLRQVCISMRWRRHRQAMFKDTVLIIVESAEMVVPAGNGDIAQLQPLDRRKLAILEDWFSDPDFYEGSDSLIMISQGRSLMHPRIMQMSQVSEIEVPAPNYEQREQFIAWQRAKEAANRCANDIDRRLQNEEEWNEWDVASIAKQTAGLSLQALRQLLIESAYRYPDDDVPTELIIARVEDFIQSQIGEDVVEFKKPAHTLNDVIGFRGLKSFMHEKLMPRIRKGGKGALAAFGVAGPIGVGKTFIFEAMANELDIPVVVLKNIRSKWFGETDSTFEKLRRVLEAIGACLVFVDEADTQFGGLGENTHETERRLTGKVQAMISDPRLKGKVVWLLMTARIEKLSPDMRRRGRAGDLIIPVLDPKIGSDDYSSFVSWLMDIVPGDKTAEEYDKISEAMRDRSAGDFASIRSEAVSEDVKTIEDLLWLIDDVLDADIAKKRRYQELQALLNYTRKMLVPDVKNPREERQKWREELKQLTEEGYAE